MFEGESCERGISQPRSLRSVLQPLIHGQPPGSLAFLASIPRSCHRLLPRLCLVGVDLCLPFPSVFPHHSSCCTSDPQSPTKSSSRSHKSAVSTLLPAGSQASFTIPSCRAALPVNKDIFVFVSALSVLRCLLHRILLAFEQANKHQKHPHFT